MGERVMPAVTLRQPWASLVAEGFKTVETRTHNRFRLLVGKRIAIHAAKRVDWKGWIALLGDPTPADADRFLRANWIGRNMNLPVGAVVCTVYVANFRLMRPGYDAAALWLADEQTYGLWLASDVRKLDPPIAARGRQGIWLWQIPDGLEV